MGALAHLQDRASGEWGPDGPPPTPTPTAASQSRCRRPSLQKESVTPCRSGFTAHIPTNFHTASKLLCINLGAGSLQTGLNSLLKAPTITTLQTVPGSITVNVRLNSGSVHRTMEPTVRLPFGPRTDESFIVRCDATVVFGVLALSLGRGGSRERRPVSAGRQRDTLSRWCESIPETATFPAVGIELGGRHGQL